MISSNNRNSVLINKFDINYLLKICCRDEAPKPTTALDYTFGRRAKTGHNIVRFSFFTLKDCLLTLNVQTE